jgi:hypothetical protein
LNTFTRQGTKPVTTEYFQLYPFIAADALLELSTAVISAVLLLREHYTSVIRIFIFIAVL